LEQKRPDIARRRERWRSLQSWFDPERLVFIDETWIKTNMAPLRGWGHRGERVRGFAPHGHWRTLTFLGALRHDQLIAPCVFDGPINGLCFRAYVDQLLTPALKPGDIVIMDNLGSHKSAAIRQSIRAVGAKLWFLPPYSPDLNPIEQAFSKIKHWMRLAQKRTIDDTYRHIGKLVSSIPSSECRNYFENAGYVSIKT
jgi:transposase